MSDKEVRYFKGEVETRAKGDKLTIAGYAAVFNSESENLGGFVETISPGAFAESLTTSDARAYWNHDSSSLPLGRQSSGTLRLEEDSTGLHYEVDLPNSEFGRSLYESVQRGDVDQSSFAFSVAEGGDEWDMRPDGLWARTLNRVNILDVSPVNDPAYRAATVSARAKSMVEKLEVKQDMYAPKRHIPADILRLVIK